MYTSLCSLIKERILILDGAMGTMIQQFGLTESDFRGERFADLPGLQKGILGPEDIKIQYVEYLECIKGQYQ